MLIMYNFMFVQYHFALEHYDLINTFGVNSDINYVREWPVETHIPWSNKKLEWFIQIS